MQSPATSTFAPKFSTDWLEVAARLPLAFALVREDALIDLCVLRRLRARARIAMIASGGCTAALLAASPRVEQLILVDTNPAQLALAKLKLHLLETEEPYHRLALLGHEKMDPDFRLRRLLLALESLNLPMDIFGPGELLAQNGPDYLGRYEFLFAALRQALGGQQTHIDNLLALSDPLEQARRVVPGTDLGDSLDRAFETTMSLSNLVRLFGTKATANPVQPFAQHFAQRTRQALATMPAATNPYLWQVLAGRLPVAKQLPWITEEPYLLPSINFVQATMSEALSNHDGDLDIVHLSNILDWLSPEEAASTLEAASRALRPGGLVLIRQLNSSLAIPALGAQFSWLPVAKKLHSLDRSFFYQDLHLGQKR